MRVKTFIILIFALLAGCWVVNGQMLIGRPFLPLNSSGPATTLSADIVVYYKVDEATGVDDRIDSGPNGEDLSAGGGVSATAGVINNAASLVSGQFLSHADSSFLSTGNIDFTWWGWVALVGSKSSDKYLIGKWTLSNNSASEYMLYFFNSGDRFRFTVSDGTSSGDVPADNFGSPTIGTYYFVVCWHDAANDQIGIQVNNGTANTLSWTSGGQDSTTGFAFGAFNSTGSGSSTMTANIDEIGLVKRLLTVDEKAYLYNSGSAETCCPFVP